jgi:hypothetical protein
MSLGPSQLSDPGRSSVENLKLHRQQQNHSLLLTGKREIDCLRTVVNTTREYAAENRRNQCSQAADFHQAIAEKIRAARVISPGEGAALDDSRANSNASPSQVYPDCSTP